MTDVMQAVQDHLAADAGVSALVSTRIYPQILPQNPTYPALIYQQITESPEPAMGSDTGLVAITVQVDSYATTYSGAKALAAAVRSALNRHRGTVSTVDIADVFLENTLDLYESEVQKRRVSQDYRVWYRIA